MPTIEINATKIKVEAIPEKPTHFYLTETIANTCGPDGERVEIMRAATNPFIFILRGEKNEAEIDIQPLLQEALLHVLRGNDYSPRDPLLEKIEAMNRADTKFEDAVSDPMIGVAELGSGWAAVRTVLVITPSRNYRIIQQTGIGRYATKDQAVVEARDWSKAEGIPLAPGIADPDPEPEPGEHQVVLDAINGESYE